MNCEPHSIDRCNQEFNTIVSCRSTDKTLFLHKILPRNGIFFSTLLWPLPITNETMALIRVDGFDFIRKNSESILYLLFIMHKFVGIMDIVTAFGMKSGFFFVESISVARIGRESRRGGDWNITIPPTNICT